MAARVPEKSYFSIFQNIIFIITIFLLQKIFAGVHASLILIRLNELSKMVEIQKQKKRNSRIMFWQPNINGIQLLNNNKHTEKTTGKPGLNQRLKQKKN